MRRVLAVVAGAAALASAGPALAQALDAQVVGSPALGAGVEVRLRLLDHATGALVLGARIDAARLFGSTGATQPATPLAEVEPGIYLLRVDLPTPGAWTLEASVTRPDLVVVVVSTPLLASADPLRVLRSDPAFPSVAPAVAQDPLAPIGPPPPALPPPG